MITVTITPQAVTIRGHANAAEKGKDIVCAAVSVLFQNLIDSLEQLTSDPIQTEVGSGCAAVAFESNKISPEARLLMRSFFIGVNEVANSCPDYVSIETTSNAVGL